MARRGITLYSWDYDPMKFCWGVGEGREGTLINYLLRTPAAKRTVVVGEGPLINSNRVAQTIAVIFSVTLY